MTEPEPPVPLLRVRNITKRFQGVTANRGIDLDVTRGETHCLLGENGAGKTTLLNILYGLVQPDDGVIMLDGKPVTIRGPMDALANGIGMVHQHFMLVPNMTVAENMALTLRPTGLPILKMKAVSRRVAQLSETHGLMVRPDAKIEDLPLGMRQRVEILKLLYRGAKLLLLDEPTGVLSPPEWRELARILRSLAAKGAAVVLITHKLDEVFTVADRCTVLRDGAVVATVGIEETDKRSLARLMVGRDVVLHVEKDPVRPGPALLEVEGLSLLGPGGRPLLDGVSFTIAEGEIFGIAGIEGNGQEALVDVLTGIQPPSAGTIRAHGQPIRVTPKGFARQLGWAVIPADRRDVGLILDLSVQDNLLLRDFDQRPYARWGMVADQAARARSLQLIAGNAIRARGPWVRVRHLSGGNQQRTVIAREMSRQPKLLIAVEPTRGLDIAAMEFVHRTILAHREQGGATLLISSELEEVLSLSDRIGVLTRGRFATVVHGSEADLETLGMLMAGEASPAA